MSFIFLKECQHNNKEEYITETICDLQSLKHLLSGRLQKKFADPYSR
jgi:hypothetical protein